MMKKRLLTTSEINSIPCNERWFRLKPVVSFEIYHDDPLNGWLAHVTGQNVLSWDTNYGKKKVNVAPKCNVLTLLYEDSKESSPGESKS